MVPKEAVLQAPPVPIDTAAQTAAQKMTMSPYQEKPRTGCDTIPAAGNPGVGMAMSQLGFPRWHLDGRGGGASRHAHKIMPTGPAGHGVLVVLQQLTRCRWDYFAEFLPGPESNRKMMPLLQLLVIRNIRENAAPLRVPHFQLYRLLGCQVHLVLVSARARFNL